MLETLTESIQKISARFTYNFSGLGMIPNTENAKKN